MKTSVKMHSVTYNFIMNAILTVSSILFPLITFPYISRVLLVEGSGKVAFAISAVTYFTMFATLGLPTYGIRACAVVRDDREKLSQTVQELLIISAITTAITYAVFFASLFLVPEFAAKKELMMVMGLSIGLTTIGVQWFYNALEQYSYITTCAIVFKLIGLILMFLLVRDPSDYVVYGFVYVVGSFGSYVLNFVRLRRFISFRKREAYDLKQHLKPTLTFFLLAAASSVYLNLDVVMLGFLKGDTEVGYYNAGIKVKTVLTTCVTSLGTVLLPRLSYYVEKQEKEAFYRMVKKAFQFVLVAATPLMVYFILFAKESILFLAGESFLPAITPMQVLMPTVLLIGLSNITGIQILTPLGEEKKVVISVLAGAILDFVLNLVLIPKMGSTGAATSTLLAEAMVVLVQARYLKKEWKQMLAGLGLGKILFPLAAATGVGILLTRQIHLSPFFTLLVSAIAFFGVYGVLLLAVREQFTTGMMKSVFRSLPRNIK